MKRSQAVLLATLILALLASRGAAEDFPPVTDEERALTSVPGEPNAPAVVLFKKGEFLMAGYGRFVGSLASHLRVKARVKILTEAGKSNGEIVIAHDDRLRLQGFAGRTVLPDGRVIPVPADSELRRRTSESRKTFVTAVIFPAVQVGAILDYQYEVTFSSPYLLEPWYFSEEMPVRHAEVVYETPRNWTYQIWSRSPLGVKITLEKQKSSKGYEVRAWADGLPAVPVDPYGPPYADLASTMMLLPSLYMRQWMMSSWLATAWWATRLYSQMTSDSGYLPKKVRAIAGTCDLHQKAEALYRFVRDDIQTQPGDGVLVDTDRTSLREVFAERRGTAFEKATLPSAMPRSP